MSNVAEDDCYTYSPLTSSQQVAALDIREISLFQPFLKRFALESLNSGGTVNIAADKEGKICGLFTYDKLEGTGAIFTGAPLIFRHFINYFEGSSIFCELEADLDREIYDIFLLEFDTAKLNHRFKHIVSSAYANDAKEIKEAMSVIFPSFNVNWVDVAFASGNLCFVVRWEKRIVGVSWVAVEGGLGRLISVGVLPSHRGLGIGTDLLFARLMWLKSMGAKRAFSEISEFNDYSRKMAQRASMTAGSKIYLYRRP